MNITITALKEGDECHLFADIFPDGRSKFCESAKPVTFMRRPMFQRDTGEFGPLLTLPLEDAKKMAKEILKL